jgi:hypothetical protein
MSSSDYFPELMSSSDYFPELMSSQRLYLGILAILFNTWLNS